MRRLLVLWFGLISLASCTDQASVFTDASPTLDGGPAFDAAREDGSAADATDAGPGEADTGPGEEDTGPSEADAGPGEADAGPGEADAGSPPLDGGSPTGSCRPVTHDEVGWAGYRDRNGLSDGDLRVSSGVLTINDDGAVVELLDHTGGIVVQGDNVIIRRLILRGSSAAQFFMIRNFGQNLTIEDVELDANGTVQNLVGTGQYTARRVYGHSMQGDGFKAQGHDAHVEDSFIWNPRPSPGAHNDGLQAQDGDRITVSCTTMDMRYRGGNFGPVESGRVHGFGGQSFWATPDSDDVWLEDSFIAAMGFPIGANGTNWGFCHLVIGSHEFRDTIHPAAMNVRGTIYWEDVTDLSGNPVPSPFPGSLPCP